ncbi:unnamed protein product [Vitrella brassicaformis CCMP3155]|uniref:Uncharacterized protein n=1 Tax=Vitrella brassicaformis (strain CCMP3155) TaxID=1169540 RepID=A0A0G4GUP4_VITBC|nr:unnamed protein product [Vitrella brassicaformis CCMP3155]|eukprot:CEM34567.1 unnamed protein product [Vitrella brassicaformis CCMP3155]
MPLQLVGHFSRRGSVHESDDVQLRNYNANVIVHKLYVLDTIWDMTGVVKLILDGHTQVSPASQRDHRGWNPELFIKQNEAIEDLTTLRLKVEAFSTRLKRRNATLHDRWIAPMHLRLYIDLQQFEA